MLGNDLIGQAQRCVRGIDVTEDAVSLDVMKAVCLDGGAGQLPRVGPDSGADADGVSLYEVANRLTPKDWEEGRAPRPDRRGAQGGKGIGILQMAPLQVPHEIGRAVRARFDIRF